MVLAPTHTARAYFARLHPGSFVAGDLLERLKLAIGERYAIERELGRGGMATVYLANDLRHQRKVAVKVLRPDLAASVGAERFLREIEIAARLQHPHILPLLDSGETAEWLFYVMPFIEGESLRDRLSKQGELPISDAVHIVCEVLDALGYAHSQGVVHRDIKPANVILAGPSFSTSGGRGTPSGGSGRVHALVTDFGVAKALSEATGGESLTTSGVAVGTPAYMAPEQATGDERVDHRADIYAIGVLAYELLAGRLPFTGMSQREILSAHLTRDPEPLRELRPSVPHALEQAIVRCLAKHPSDRWQTAEELLSRLEPHAISSSDLVPVVRREARGWAGIARRVEFVGVAVASLIALGFLAWQQWKPRALEMGRRTQLTLAEGLEVDPAISPSGDMIAYAAGPLAEMKLYVRQLGGGNPVAVTGELPGSQRRPAWHPDGRRLAFQSRRGIELVPALGGQSTLLIDTRNGAVREPAISPDGLRIAFARGNTIVARGLEGGEEQLVARAEDPHSLAWSPDGEWIAYVSGNSRSVHLPEVFGNLGPSAVWIVHVTRGEPVAVAGGGYANLDPAWTLNGRLLFISDRDGGRDIYELRLGRSGTPSSSPTRVTTGMNAQMISLSADGARLAYSVYSETSNVWSLRIPERDAVYVATASPVTTGNQIVETINVSPDGRWLAFDSNRSGNADIYRMLLPSGTPEQLTTHPADDFHPAWSADGSQIAFHSYRNPDRDIFVMPASGGQAELAAGGPGEQVTASWAPSSARFVFHDLTPSSRTLGLVTRLPSGKWERTGALAGEHGHRPKWSPDGRRIAYLPYLERAPSSGSTAAGAAGAAGGIVVVSPDGKDRRWLLTVRDSLTEPIPQFLEWSSDSRTLYYAAFGAGHWGVWSVAAGGGTPRQLVRFDRTIKGISRNGLAVHGNTIYLTLSTRESDLWTADLKAR